MMQIDKYQELTRQTIVYTPNRKVEYLVLGLLSEAGEIASLIKKDIRGDDIDDLEYVNLLYKEMGDVLWYLARLADEYGVWLSQIAEENIEKLQSRDARGVLHGNGDNR